MTITKFDPNHIGKSLIIESNATFRVTSWDYSDTNHLGCIRLKYTGSVHINENACLSLIGGGFSSDFQLLLNGLAYYDRNFEPSLTLNSPLKMGINQACVKLLPHIYCNGIINPITANTESASNLFVNHLIMVKVIYAEEIHHQLVYFM